MIDFKKRCADCVCLIEKNGVWCCDECFGQKCADIDDCPEGLTAEEVQQAQELTPEQKKNVKEATITTSVEKKERKPRTVKENAEKIEIISEIVSTLEQKYGISVEIVNKQREISFNVGENNYKLLLTATRKPKNKEN